jgi:hypothetical protein
MKGHRILHREYFIELERNVYSWRIVAITHRLENSFKPSAGGGLSLSLLNPHRGRTTAGDSPNAALRLSGVCEHGKSCNYFMALAVATENRHEFPSASSRSHRPECCGDHIFSSPGDNDAEDIGGRCLTITPDRQSCIKVLQGNLVSSVEQRIEES